MRRTRIAAINASLVASIALGVVLAPTLSGASGPKSGATRPRLAPAAAVHNTCERNKHDVPSCGVLWGMYVPRQAYAPLESAIGRRLDVVKNYVDWRADGGRFPNGQSRHLAAGGRILDYSWNPINFQTRAPISYASIAAGVWDRSVIVPEARDLKSFHHRVFVDFGHEFDARDHLGLGSAAEYKAAYRHIIDVMHAHKVHNVIWSWVATGFTAHEAQDRAAYSGRHYIDWIGYDPYNFAQCQSIAWRRPYQTFNGFYHWLRRQPGMRSKPIMLAEYGTAPGRLEQQWYGRLAHALSRLPRIKAVMQFDYGTSTGCDFRLTPYPTALIGFAAAATTTYVLGSKQP